MRLCDERAGNRRAEVVLAFVDCICADHREDEIGDEFVLQIDGIVGGSTGSLRFFGETVEFFFLPDVCGESNHFGIEAIFNPLYDYGGVETSRIC